MPRLRTSRDYRMEKQDEWDGWLGLGMTSTQRLESVRPKIQKNNVIV